MAYKDDVGKIIDDVLKAKSKGKWRIEAKKSFSTPYVHAFVAIGTEEARVDQLQGFVEDIENVLAYNEMYISVAFRLGPARFEIDVPSPPTAYLADAWGTVVAQPVNNFLYTAFFRYLREKRFDVYPRISDAQNTHTLFTGSTGSGKSVCANAALTTLLMLNSPDVLSVVICDPNGTGFNHLKGCPHVVRIAVEPEEIDEALAAVHAEMNRRSSLRDPSVKSKRILVVIDEINDLFEESESAVGHVMSIARRGRGLGINLFGIGQKMSANIPPNVQTNFTARITGRMNSSDDARRTSGDNSQAHKLPVGKGRFEFRNGPPIGGQEIIGVQSYMVEEDRMDWYAGQICDRWRGIDPHYRMRSGGSTTEEDEDERLSVVRALLRAEPKVTPHDLCKHHKAVRGKGLNYSTAKMLLEKASAARLM